MASEPYTEPALPPGMRAEGPGPAGGDTADSIEGRGPWYLGYQRLKRNKIAIFFGILFILIVLFCLAAPLWANDVAHTGPDTNHLTEKIDINGHPTNVVSTDGIPIGPGPHAKFLLGADPNGRDVMVRLMYGGRTSIFIGVAAAFVTTILAVIAG